MDTPALDRLDQLIEQLRSLRQLDALTRATAARDIGTDLRVVLGQVGNEAITHLVGSREHGEASQLERSRVGAGLNRMQYHELAGQLGLSHSRVNHSVTSYRRWLSELNAAAA